MPFHYTPLDGAQICCDAARVHDHAWRDAGLAVLGAAVAVILIGLATESWNDLWVVVGFVLGVPLFVVVRRRRARR